MNEALSLAATVLEAAQDLDKPALVLAIAGSVLLAVSWLLLGIARHADHANWLQQRAPLLPLRLVNVRDDVWLEGETRCERPLVVPHFGERALAYDYRLEEKITESYTDSKGHRRTRTRWETREHRREATDFELVQGEEFIRVHADEATLRDLPGLGPDYDGFGRLRHSASFLPAGPRVAALGSVGEHRAWLEKHENIPLLITTRRRDEFLKREERAERALRWIGFALQPLALGGLFYAGGLAFALPSRPPAPWHPPLVLLAAFLGVLVFVLCWSLYTFNTMVLYRNRTRTAWKQIDVDLKQRFDLIPQLAAVIGAATEHERSLLRRIADLRAALGGAAARDRIRGESELSAAMQQVIAVRESYPELSSQPLFQKLHRELVAIEEKIAHARGFFDECAAEYNTFIEQAPRGLLAGMCGFAPWPLFRAAVRERRVPEVRVTGPRRPSGGAGAFPA